MGSPRSPMLTFIGAAGTVTGSKSLLDTETSRILVDCGLFQGKKHLRTQNWERFPVDPATIDAVVLTHAHLDHCGYLPRLYRLGFRGPVFCTEGTSRLAEIVLKDSAKLQEEQAEHANRKGYSRHDPALPLYTREDADACLRLFRPVAFDDPTTVADGVTAAFRPAGHILGAAFLDLELEAHGSRVAFSGDVGRSTHPLLRPPAVIGAARTVVTESTYGNEEHDDADAAESIAAALADALERHGVCVVPAFAVDRTEMVLWHLDRLVAAGRLPDVPVFVDSPMANRALDVYEDETTRGSAEIRPELHGTRLFGHLRLAEVRSVDESKALNDRRGPMIIISASGMATGGRVIHHLVHRVGERRNLVLLVGYQAPGTRGDRLLSGERHVKMLGAYHQVRAEIRSVGLSSHADRSELVDWVATAHPAPGTVYVNHGEPDASSALAEALFRELDLVAVTPTAGERVRLDL